MCLDLGGRHCCVSRPRREIQMTFAGHRTLVVREEECRRGIHNLLSILVTQVEWMYRCMLCGGRHRLELQGSMECLRGDSLQRQRLFLELIQMTGLLLTIPSLS